MYLITKPKPTFWWPGLAAPGTHLLARLRQRLAYWQRLQQFDEQARHLDGLQLVAAVVSHLDLTIEVEAAELNYLPTRGAFLAIVNQPGGLLASLVVLHVLGQARPDLRLVLGEAAAPLLARLTEHVLVTKKSTGRGTSGLRPLLRQLHHEVPLAVFPLAQAGPGCFSAAAERLLTTMRLPIVPVALSCQRPIAASWWARVPGLLYQPSSLLDELLDQYGATVRVQLGAAVLPTELHSWPVGARLAYLRTRLAALGPAGAADAVPVLPPTAAVGTDCTLLEADLAALPAKRRLVQCRQWEVYVAKAPELPHLLPEIDRLRALTLGPGDELPATHGPEQCVAQDYYRYLVLYDRRARRLVGASRLGHGKRILHQRGRQGFSLHATCKLKRELCPLLRQSLELTQAFIRAEYQGQALPLGLVWEGLAQYLSGRPQYRYLLGQVNLNPTTLPVSKTQLLDFMQQHCLAATAATHVRPRKSVRYYPRASGAPTGLPAHLDREQLVQALLANSALGGMGVPPRLRPYFCQQAQLLSVHLDPTSSSTVQGIVLLDTATLGTYTYRLAERAAPQLPPPGQDLPT